MSMHPKTILRIKCKLFTKIRHVSFSIFAIRTTKCVDIFLHWEMSGQLKNVSFIFIALQPSGLLLKESLSPSSLPGGAFRKLIKDFNTFLKLVLSSSYWLDFNTFL